MRTTNWNMSYQLSGGYRELGREVGDMPEEYEETVSTDSGSKTKTLVAIGGAFGAWLGSKRNNATAVVGAVIGAAVGFLAARRLGSGGGDIDETTQDPVVVTVADGDDELDDEATAETDGDSD